MVLGTIFEMIGAITVGARTAETIKNNIIPPKTFEGEPGVQMLAFTCALAGASLWVMWCTKHSAHVSSSYSLISSVAGVGVAVAGASKVQWGWNKGKGLGAIFAGLGMAPAASACFGAIIFMLIKVTVHLRKNPIPWAIWTAPFFFLVAGTICTLSVVYKGSPNLGLNKKPAWYVATVTVSCGVGLALLSFLFFVPYLHAKVVKRDHTVRWYHAFMGPLLFRRPAPEGSEMAVVPDYAVVQHDDEMKPEHSSDSDVGVMSHDEKGAVVAEHRQLSYKELVDQGQERFHSKLRVKRGPLGWAMRYLHENKIHTGEIYEKKNMVITLKRIPAQLVVGALYGVNYDIHAAQTGIHGTPEGARMERVYGHAKKYPNEVEHTYSFVQVITACTASFAHGANDIGNAVGPWAVIYGAWNTGTASTSKAPVPIWQLAVLSATLSLGLVTYGYNIMKVMGNKITYHSPSRGMSPPFASLTHSHSMYTDFYRLLNGNGRRTHRPHLLPILAPRLNLHVHHRRHRRRRSVQRHSQGCELAAGGSLGVFLDHDNPYRWYYRWTVYGYHPQCSSFYLKGWLVVLWWEGRGSRCVFL
jgi:sodium-dependent phosphate transporter